MLRKNTGMFSFLSVRWVLTTLAPRNRQFLGSGAPVTQEGLAPKVLFEPPY